MSRLDPPVTVPPRRRRAGGRSERIRLRVAQTCLDLLGAGNADFGPVEVARRSGVSRATIHRWWPTKADLLREALALHTSSLSVPDTGVWVDGVLGLAVALLGLTIVNRGRRALLQKKAAASDAA